MVLQVSGRPTIAKLGLSFPEVSTPYWFNKDPTFAWGFFGHRYSLYTSTVPHSGFNILNQWTTSRPYFIFTSNIDGHFQKAGFDELNVLECHGSIHYLQCVANSRCRGDIWPAEGMQLEVDELFKAKEPLPMCRNCGSLARPNVLMFGDWEWASDRTDEQQTRFHEVYDRTLGPERKMVVIEIGAGEAVPTVRRFGESLVFKERNAVLIRINPRDIGRANRQVISLQMGALDALTQIHELIETS